MLASALTRLTVTGPLIALLLGVAAPEGWKAENDRGNRYEGSVRIPVGNPDLELLSFVGHLRPFPKDVILKVRFFLPTETAAFISAQELRDRNQYRMEPKPRSWRAGQWNEFAPWPTREVIDPLGVDSRNVGVVVRLGDSGPGSGEVAPAFVYHEQRPPPLQSYRFVFRPGLTLRGLRYTVYRLDGAAPVKLFETDLKAERFTGRFLDNDTIDLQSPEGRITLIRIRQ